MEYWIDRYWIVASSGPRMGGEAAALRAVLAIGVGCGLALLIGKLSLGWLGRFCRDPIVSPSATLERLHRHKATTPTMGGLFLVTGTVAAMLMLGDLSNRYLGAALGLVIGMTGIGLLDDALKLRRRRGISARAKLALQSTVAVCAVAATFHEQIVNGAGPVLAVPLLAGVSLGAWIIPLGTLVIVGTSNAVNLTDGLDGLAGGCAALALGTMGVAAHVAGSANLAAACGVVAVPGATELALVAAAGLGGVLGFLWFNRHPARVFMGDTGSLPLGGLLGFIAVAARQEWLLLIVGGVFVAEAASVILQVGYYKWRRKRLLRCAPLHHHYQFRGWAENLIVRRFWAAALLCAALGLGILGASAARQATSSESGLALNQTFTQFK